MINAPLTYLTLKENVQSLMVGHKNNSLKNYLVCFLLYNTHIFHFVKKMLNLVMEMKNKHILHYILSCIHFNDTFQHENARMCV